MPQIEGLLEPGGALALVPGPDGAAGRPWSCGKTQLAVHLVESCWRSHGIELLAWVNASDRSSVLSGYAEAAAALGMDDGGSAELAAARFLGWLGSTSRPWLVVLDDVRGAADLEGLLPGGPAGRVLVTAADSGAVPGTRQAAVGALSMREAMSYLFDRLTTNPDQRNGAYDLAEDLGGDPSALAQAGAVMAGADMGCRIYQCQFARYQERLRAAGGRQPQPAGVTWMLSAEYAEELVPGGGTWQLLVLAALLGSHGIPLAVLAGPAACRHLAGAGVPSPDARLALSALDHAGLACAGPSVYVGRPVQRAVLAAAAPELLGRAVRAAADAVLEAWPTAGEPRSGLAAQLRACTASLLDYADDALWDAGSCHRVLLAAGQSLDAARLAGPAAAWWRELHARSERLLGPDHPDTLITAGQLANALGAAGQHMGAVQYARLAAEGRDRVLGRGHPAALAARISLGRALAASGDADQALRVLRDAVARSERAYGPGDQEGLASLDEYAAAFLAAGDAATAMRFCKRSLAGHEQAYGPADPATLAAALRLANTSLAHGKAKDAIGQYKRVLAAREQALGPGHPDTLSARAGLAAAYDAAGRIGDALREHQVACAGCERAFGPDHPLTLSRYAGLALAYYAAGQLGDALTVLRDSAARAERALSPDDPVTRRLRQAQASITADLAGE